MGWHSWRARPESGAVFDGFGLRDDRRPAPPPFVRQRKSWFAYQRFTSIVLSTSAVQMLLPTSLEIDASSDESDDVVVIEFRGLLREPDMGKLFSWGYLLLVDAWRDTLTAFTLVPRRRGATTPLDLGSVVEVGTIPGAISTPTVISPEDYPYGSSVFPASVNVAVGGLTMISLQASNGPRLFLSSAQLSWSIR